MKTTFITRKIQQFLAWLSSILPMDMPDEDIDQYFAWGISAQLAAVPPCYLEQVPLEVASLIRAAKSLHVEMADGALERELNGEPCPVLG